MLHSDTCQPPHLVADHPVRHYYISLAIISLSGICLISLMLYDDGNFATSYLLRLLLFVSILISY